MWEVAPSYAAPLIAGISAAMDPVTEFPLSGRVVPEFDPSHLREVIFENYRIVYIVLADDVYVLGVFHGARDMTTALRNIGVRD